MEVWGPGPLPALRGEAAEGRKCRALTPHFHHEDGRLSPVLHRESILLQPWALAGVAVVTLGVPRLWCGLGHALVPAQPLCRQG